MTGWTWLSISTVTACCRLLGGSPHRRKAVRPGAGAQPPGLADRHRGCRESGIDGLTRNARDFAPLGARVGLIGEFGPGRSSFTPRPSRKVAETAKSAGLPTVGGSPNSAGSPRRELRRHTEVSRILRQVRCRSVVKNGVFSPPSGDSTISRRPSRLRRRRPSRSGLVRLPAHAASGRNQGGGHHPPSHVGGGSQRLRQIRRPAFPARRCLARGRLPAVESRGSTRALPRGAQPQRRAGHGASRSVTTDSRDAPEVTFTREQRGQHRPLQRTCRTGRSSCNDPINRTATTRNASPRLTSEVGAVPRHRRVPEIHRSPSCSATAAEPRAGGQRSRRPLRERFPASDPEKTRARRLRRVSSGSRSATGSKDMAGDWHLEARYAHWRPVRRARTRDLSDGTLRLALPLLEGTGQEGKTRPATPRRARVVPPHVGDP